MPSDAYSVTARDFTETEESAVESTGVDPVLRSAVREFLEDLTQTQEQLLTVLAQKEAALVAAQWGSVRQIEQREIPLQSSLRVLIGQRSALIKRFHGAGVAGNTLQDVLRNCGWWKPSELRVVLQGAMERADRLQQQGWSLWVLTQRAGRFYEQMLGLIAQGGKEAPCYQQHPHVGSSPGGSLLDASI